MAFRFRSSQRLLDATCPVEWGHPLNRSLVAEWAAPPLSGWQGSNILRDLVRGAKTPHDGTLNSGATWQGNNRSGGYGRLNFNSSGYVNALCSSPASLTASFWFRPSRNFNYEVWIDTYAGVSSTKDARVYTDNTGTMHIDLGGGGTINTSSGIVTTNLWHHIAITRTAAGNSSLYFDGKAAGSVSGSGPGGSTTNIYFGKGADGFACNGSMDAMLYFQRPFSAAEVAALYDQSRRGNPDRWRWLSQTAWFLPQTATTPATGWEDNSPPVAGRQYCKPNFLLPR